MTDEPQSQFCEQCGSPLLEGVAFCESCGAAVPGNEAPGAETPAAAAPAADAVPPTPVATAVAPAAPAEAGRGSPRWVPLVIGIVGVLVIVASIVSAL